MPQIYNQRMTVEMDGEFVVLLIGFRINKLWKLHRWIPVARAMFRMIKELEDHPEIGCLGYERHGFMFRQYWKSFEHLEAYARNREAQHWPAWVAFNKRLSGAGADIGIWHETFLIAAGAYEAIYNGMPKVGLAKCGNFVPIGQKTETSRNRLAWQQTPPKLSSPVTPEK
jgi:hypothetical protein